MKKHWYILCLCLLMATGSYAEDGKFMKFMYRVGVWLDDYSLKGLDTSYIALPEFPWRIALTNSEVGIHSTFAVKNNSDAIGRITLQSVTTPSIDLGFHVGLRTLGFGYSWDVMHAYARKLNLSMGGKQWGVELMRQTSTNLHSVLSFPDLKINNFIDLGKKDVWITNTNLTAWYVFNGRHYSHNAAIKQAYIQRKTAGSLLINLSYLNTDISFGHDPEFDGITPVILENVHEMVTHQVAVGAGYGINYTPNHGKVLLHASAAVQAVFYSINYISYSAPDSLKGFAYPSYTIRPTTPIHFTGTMRAAVSWEINKWVHLSARAQVDNIRFKAHTTTGLADLNNWNWQTNLAVAVRLGVGKDRINRALGIEPAPAAPLPEKESEQTDSKKKLFTMPQWVTDYFFSPQ